MLMKDLHPLLEYLQHHPHMGQLFTFLVAFAESLPLIGTVIPGTITMTLVGFLIGTDAMPAFLTLATASIAALIGDCIGFAIGYWYNERLLNRWPFKTHPQWIQLGEKFFVKHGGKSIIIGRFVGPARSTVPLIAGLLKLTWVRFMIAAIPSAILWALVYTVPGILLGALSKEIPAEKTTQFLLYGVITIAIIWFIFWVIQHFFIQLSRYINRLTDRCWQFLSTHAGSRRFIRTISNAKNPADHHQLTLIVFGLISFICFLILLVNVQQQTFLINWNAPFFHLLQSLRTQGWADFFILFTILGAPINVLFTSLLICACFVLYKQWRMSAHVLLAIGLSIVAVECFKFFSHSLRPMGFELVKQTSSFPSGHVTLSFVMLCFCSYLMGEANKNLKWMVWTVSGILIGLIAFSRLYLGAHWLTDVIGSLFLGVTILLLCIMNYRRYATSSPLSTRKTVAIIVGAFLIVFACKAPFSFHQQQRNVKPIWPVISVSQKDWWQDPLKYAPIYRKNRLGHVFQPFNIQWLGSLQSIETILQQSHWQTVKTLDLKNQLKRFASFKPEYHMPVLPWLYHNRPPLLVMFKQVPNQENMIIELRLWQSDIDIPDSVHPLWLGGLDVRVPPKTLMSIRHRATIQLEGHAGIQLLAKDTERFQHKIITVNTAQLSQLDWNGKILVIAPEHF